MRSAPPTEQILGIRFFNGTPASAVSRMNQHGGLLVAPSGTCFERLVEDAEYRRAVTSADVVLPDSGAMVTLWRLLQRRSLRRISGLAFLKELFASEVFRVEARTCWVLPHEKSRERLLAWASVVAIPIREADCYLAPVYSQPMEDEALLGFLEDRRPRYVIIGIGAGPQEKLGQLLRERLSFRPAIICTGGALGFISGDQVAIPGWADRLYLGWLLRLLRDPRVFIPRLWKARLLPALILRHGPRLPPSRGGL
jgi:UDP-N-acetyl-D-mannosaminuronic acid transferase (WecB/TagA/CpsF family)